METTLNQKYLDEKNQAIETHENILNEKILIHMNSIDIIKNSNDSYARIFRNYLEKRKNDTEVKLFNKWYEDAKNYLDHNKEDNIVSNKNINLNIATFNIYQGWGSGLPDFFETLPNDLDLIFLQESGKNVRIKSFENNFQYGNRTEIVTTMVKENSEWTPLKPHATFTERPEGLTERHAYVQTFKHKNGAEIRIANVHLYGGRYDEQKIPENEDIAKEIKLLLLKDVVETGNADIIVGDFNSDENLSNFQFLISNEWTQEKAEMWHKAPSEYLKSKNFIKAEGESIIDTSIFGLTPDCVWFNPNSLEDIQYEYQVIDAISSKASDHNPVIVKFKYTDDNVDDDDEELVDKIFSIDMKKVFNIFIK